MSVTAYAIPLALLTTSAFNAGLIVEKRALSQMPALRLSRIGHVGQTLLRLLSTPAWVAGLALMLAGLACQVIVLTLEPISLVQPVLASGVVLTLVLSRLVLRERLGGAESWCVAIMALSLILLAFSQDADSGQSTRNAGALPMTAVVLPSMVVGLVIAAWPWWPRRPGGRHAVRRPRAQGPAATAMCGGIGTGLLYGVSALSSKGLSAVVGHHHTIVGLVVAVLSSPYLYLLGACSAFAMLLYQAALQACRASILIPTSSVVSSGFFLVAGTWLFHEQLPASPVKLAFRLAGTAAAVLTIFILARQNPDASREERPEQALVSTD